jgi:hypothetical protein
MTITIFVHIPKTAGSTLRPILTRQYRTGEICQLERFNAESGFELKPNAQPSRIRLYLGHIPFGLHEYLTQPATYITMLREPVDRVLSHYFHARRNPQSPFYDAIQSMSIGDFVRSGLSGDTENRMTKILAGEWVAHLDAEQSCTSAQFETAKANLDRWFPIIGLSERFDESLLLMKHRFQWKNIYYGKRNVTASRPLKDAVPAEELAVVEEYNQYDLAIYEHAIQKFDALLAAQDTTFHQELKRFQTLNGPFNSIYTNYDKLYQLALSQPWLRKTGIKLKRSLTRKKQ